jgi:heme-degrading monooxygenase HmoA
MRTHLLFRALLALAVTVAACGVLPASAQPGPSLDGPVTVLVEVTLETNTAAPEALAALNDMRTMMTRQAGFLSQELLQNLNASNAPRCVHVSRWASMVYWAALFRAPEFSRLNAHGNLHYTVSASAFMPAD